MINSSPREPLVQSSGQETRFEAIGNLTWMLRWLIPYFYERSQIEDALSAEDIVVASVAPSASPDGWPFLTDFQSHVIERMFKEPEDDRPRRIGSIESWGNPSRRFATQATPATAPI